MQQKKMFSRPRSSLDCNFYVCEALPTAPSLTIQPQRPSNESRDAKVTSLLYETGQTSSPIPCTKVRRHCPPPDFITAGNVRAASCFQWFFFCGWVFSKKGFVVLYGCFRPLFRRCLVWPLLTATCWRKMKVFWTNLPKLQDGAGKLQFPAGHHTAVWILVGVAKQLPPFSRTLDGSGWPMKDWMLIGCGASLTLTSHMLRRTRSKKSEICPQTRCSFPTPKQYFVIGMERHSPPLPKRLPQNLLSVTPPHACRSIDMQIRHEIFI